MVVKYFRKRGRISEVLGAALAYVFALQLFLSAAVATQMAVGDAAASPFTICYGASSSQSDDGNPAPSVHHHEACAICAFASVTPTLSGFCASIIVHVFQSQSAFKIAQAATPATKQNDPRTSRGPPSLT